MLPDRSVLSPEVAEHALQCFSQPERCGPRARARRKMHASCLLHVGDGEDASCRATAWAWLGGMGCYSVCSTRLSPLHDPHTQPHASIVTATRARHMAAAVLQDNSLTWPLSLDRSVHELHKLPSNRVHLIQITTQDTAGHPWPTLLLSSPDLSDLCDDASRLAPPLMAHQPTAGSPFPYSPWDPPPLRRPCSRRLTSRSLTSSLPLYLI